MVENLFVVALTIAIGVSIDNYMYNRRTREHE